MIDERIPAVDRKSWSFQDLLGQNKYNAFTPTLTFATPGDLNVTYTVRIGSWTRMGNLVMISVSINTSGFTHTTASGNLRVTGLPFTVQNTANHFPVGTLSMSGWLKVGYTVLASYGTPGQSYLEFAADGSAQAHSTLASGDVPTGGTIFLYSTLAYMA